MRSKFLLRCTICDSVSDQNFSNAYSDTGRVVSSHFYQDPKFPESFICDDCNHEINLVSLEFSMSDELYTIVDGLRVYNPNGELKFNPSLKKRVAHIEPTAQKVRR